MSAVNPVELLKAGRRILDPILAPRGFRFHARSAGLGSGGYYAEAEYVRRDRRIELHFRHSLGLVRYHIGPLSVSHDEYMDGLFGTGSQRAYPGFSSNPLDGFRHLASDLERLAPDFLEGPADGLVRAAETKGSKGGFARLSQVIRADENNKT